MKPKAVFAEIVEDHEPIATEFDHEPVGRIEKIQPSDPEDEGFDPSFDDEELKTEPASRALAVPTPESERLPSSTDPFVLYMNEVRKYPVLSREEEQVIAKKYFDTKDPDAAQALVKANLRFVVKVAAEYSKFGAKLIDLVQEGNVGLMHAVREFNPYKGNRLITYAVWWIRGYIQEYLMRQYSLVRIGTTQTQRRLFYQLQKQKEALEAMGDHPDYALLSSRLNASQEEVRDMAQRLSGRDVSLDRPVDEGASTRLSDLQKDDSEVPLDEQIARAEQLSLLKEKIDEIRPELNERELILLEERLLADEPLTLQEIGEKYGITREAVRQAEARLMNKIRQKMTP
ncbi:MAG: RNA polymerase factor sigma-32 [Bdellovibrionaceae bacterium]|nr:RNA polymerase factor sigma-32 [Pseudobdellovibrionaceae bacterium]